MKEADEEDERDRVAPNMGAGGSHPQATSDPRKEEKEKKETRVRRWADCNDEEVKENEEEVGQEKESRQWETTEERLLGLEEVEREQEGARGRGEESAGGARANESAEGARGGAN